MNEKILIATKGILPADILKMLFDNKKLEGSITIVHDGEKALDFIIEHRPRIILLDVYLPVLSALAVMEELNRINLHPRVICTCSEVSRVLCVKLFKAGVSGLIDYRTPLDDAKRILRRVEAGKVMIPDLIEEALGSRDFEINPDKYNPLTMRQAEVLQLVGEGYTNMEISKKLNISRKTVEKHKSTLRDKMGLSSSAKIAVFAITHGFVEVREVGC